MIDPREASLFELKEALNRLSGPNLIQLLLKIDKDPRVGAVKLAKSKRESIARARREDDRLWRMMKYEREAEAEGYRFIAGADEVGRGALAGPIVASAVILKSTEKIIGINDSKKLSSKQRESIAVIIKDKAVAWSVMEVSAAQIDTIGLQAANIKALNDAIDTLKKKPDFVICDGFKLKGKDMPTLQLEKGDSLSQTVAAASILAKVYRDRLMVNWHEDYPNYFFSMNKGYGTLEHIEAIKEKGPCVLHRTSFYPVNREDVEQTELLL